MWVGSAFATGKYRRLFASSGAIAFPAARAAATSGRSCSEANTLFFEADALTGEEPAQHPGVGLDAMLGQQPLGHRRQRQIGLGLDQRQQPGPMRRQPRAAVPALRQRDRKSTRLNSST